MNGYELVLGGFAAGLVIGGWAAAELGRLIYNRKMEELRGLVDRARDELQKIIGEEL